MRRSSWARAVLLAALAGCGGSDLVKRVEKLAERACACDADDRDCALAVNADFSTLLDKPENARISKSEEERLATAVDKLTKCVNKRATPTAATGSARPPATITPPETESPAESPAEPPPAPPPGESLTGAGEPPIQ